MKQPRPKSTTRGFSRAVTLMQKRIRDATESRGFAQARLLTHWAEIVGEATAKIAHPVDVSYARGGMGATLTILTSGAQAPMLEMQKEQLRERVNACYGYNAISRIRITQTAATGFAEGQMAFDHGPAAPRGPKLEAKAAARDLAAPVKNDALRLALEALGANVMTKCPETGKKY
ncbi:DUF721 domain-containing protein [Thalassorhabdomicrobium marinisediminis]|uniref:DUF721 domain-containing protein n=1 Tax=Thalassorhabdomicrobium marinisediminis TaxID=2170577 RepID=UPI00249289D5|nr:DUF721 domain-containing protein [Thalassorhabdomicrobium marinisediminis]